MFRGWQGLLDSVKDDDGVSWAAYEANLTYPYPWGLGLRNVDTAYSEYREEQAARFLASFTPTIAEFSATCDDMRRFERRQPALETTGGTFHLHRESGSPTTATLANVPVPEVYDACPFHLLGRRIHDFDQLTASVGRGSRPTVRVLREGKD